MAKAHTSIQGPRDYLKPQEIFTSKIQIALLTKYYIDWHNSLPLRKTCVQFQTKIYIPYFSTPIYTTEQRQRSIVSNTLNAGQGTAKTEQEDVTVPCPLRSTHQKRLILPSPRPAHRMATDPSMPLGITQPKAKSERTT